MKVRGGNTCCTPLNARSHGVYKRSSDGQVIKRYCCKVCKSTFSAATLSPLKWQKKRHINHPLMELLSNNVNLYAAARILRVNPKTVAKKLRFLGSICQEMNLNNCRNYAQINDIQFDELQTIEHTKLKPLSVAVAVSKRERKILGFQVSSMPATGHLAKISRKKYGKRPDDRLKGIRQLFDHLSRQLSADISISSDECPFYKGVVKKYFPSATYTQYLGKKGCIAGQGELKKTVFDPIFTINHTFAMMRANISRLIRKTWNTTKKVKGLIDHLNIYVWMHNTQRTPLFSR
ncbi:MAG: transposase [Candidatus Margulisiibacteriota bacterium]|nr:transposase [Candidatus Margulisiibacteriota bacterium]